MANDRHPAYLRTRTTVNDSLLLDVHVLYDDVAPLRTERLFWKPILPGLRTLQLQMSEFVLDLANV